MIFFAASDKEGYREPYREKFCYCHGTPDSVDAEKQWQKEYSSQLEHQCPQKRDCSRYQSVV